TQQTTEVTYSAEGFVMRASEGSAHVDGVINTRGTMRVSIDGRHLDAAVINDGDKRHVFMHGQSWLVRRVDNLLSDDVCDDVKGGLLAPMPGKIIALAVTEG